MTQVQAKEYTVGIDVVYIPQGRELDIAAACHRLRFPLMLRGPTGTGKTTLVQYLSRLLHLPLVAEPCNEDTLAADLIGRKLPNGWQDGSATFSLRFNDGAIYYLDELGEARQDAMVVVHSLTDDRRTLEVRSNNEILKAYDSWMVAASYNPAYQLQSKVKPSTAQRFITVDIPFPQATLEEKIIHTFLNREAKEREHARVSKLTEYHSREGHEVPIKDLIKLAGDYRRMAQTGDALGLREGPGPRLVARTAALIQYGLPIMDCIESGIINPLTYDLEQKQAMLEVAKKLFR